MRGGKKMRKLNKINSGRLDTIEAYACVCTCNCTNACSGYECAISSTKAATGNRLNISMKNSAVSSGKSSGYRK